MRIWNRADRGRDQSPTSTRRSPRRARTWWRAGRSTKAGGTIVRGSAGTTLNGTIIGTNFNWTRSRALQPRAAFAARDPTGLTATAQTLRLDPARSGPTIRATRRASRSCAPRPGAGGPFCRSSTSGANVTSYVDGGAQPRTPSSCYRVRAANGVGPSNYTTDACATTPPEASQALALLGTATPTSPSARPPALGLDQFTLECWFRRDGAGVTHQHRRRRRARRHPADHQGPRPRPRTPDVDINYFLGIRAPDDVLVRRLRGGRGADRRRA